MEAGKLRHRVAIEAPTTSTNEFGEAVVSWSVVAEVWANIDPMVGEETWQSRQVLSTTTHAVRLRGPRVIGPNWRLNFCGRILEIKSALRRDERAFEIQLLCVESE